MTSPDAEVTAYGETVTLRHINAAVFTADDTFDEAASTLTDTAVKAIVSQPSEKELRAYQGREQVPELRLTVLSSVDVRSDRPGRPDWVVRGGRTYQVFEVRDDRHPWTGDRKKSVLLGALPGR